MCVTRHKALDLSARQDYRARFKVFAELCAELRPRGIMNLLFSDGEFLYVHNHKHHWHHGDNPTAPGLWHLQRSMHTASSPSLAGLHVQAGVSMQIHLLASVPLSDENWQPLKQGVIRVFRAGADVTQEGQYLD